MPLRDHFRSPVNDKHHWSGFHGQWPGEIVRTLFDLLPPGFHASPSPDHARRANVTGRLTEFLGQDRTWTARQLAEALGPGAGIGHRQTRRYLGLLRAGYRRTAQTVGHKQDRKKVERAGTVLANLKKKLRRAG